MTAPAESASSPGSQQRLGGIEPRQCACREGGMQIVTSRIGIDTTVEIIRSAVQQVAQSK